MRRMGDPRADNEAGGEEKILFFWGGGFEYSGTWPVALSKHGLAIPAHFIFTLSITVCLYVCEIDTLAGTEIPACDIGHATKQTAIDCNVTHRHSTLSVSHLCTILPFVSTHSLFVVYVSPTSLSSLF